MFAQIKSVLYRLRNKIWHWYLIKALGRLGEGSILYPGVMLTYPENIYIGTNVSIAPGASIGASSQGRVMIGDRSAVAAGVRIVTATHDPNVLPIVAVGINKSVNIGNDVWIGTGAIILPGVTIHDGVVVAAGAVVAKDVSGDCLIGGVPAKVIRQLDSREKRFERGSFII